MIHERIRRARILRGLTLEELARQLGDITKQGVSKFEKGHATPSSTRLLQLAKIFQVKPEYFFRSDALALAPLEFRKLAKMPKGRQHQIEEQMRDHLERYIALERCFDAADIRTPTTPSRSIPVQSIEEAEQAANHLRDQWALGNNPIANLTELLEEHGIKIVLLDANDDFDGACAATSDEQHVLIALNKHRPGERMRFTAAHELGHWVMSLPEDMPEKEKENCCHRFAGAFLYPAASLAMDFGNHQRGRVHVRELAMAKRHYGLSMQAVLRRLQDRNLLSDSGYKSHYVRLSIDGWRKEEPEPLPPEQPVRFESMVYWGLAEGLFTESRAAEFLQQPIAMLDLPLGAEHE